MVGPSPLHEMVMSLKGIDVFIFVIKKLSLPFTVNLKIKTKNLAKQFSLLLNHLDVSCSKQAYFPALPRCL